MKTAAIVTTAAFGESNFLKKKIDKNTFTSIKLKI
jgi:hypothetical protein